MSIDIFQVREAADIAIIAKLAREIWSQHFTPIIGASQVEYMLDRFQSHGAIAAQIDSGWNYYLARLGDEAVGYVGLVTEEAERQLMLSKIYVRQSARGFGVGTSFLDLVGQKCRRENLERIWLTVNRHNIDTIAWYQRYGFTIVDEVKKDIGGGYFMDDYIMEKVLVER